MTHNEKYTIPTTHGDEWYPKKSPAGEWIKMEFTTIFSPPFCFTLIFGHPLFVSPWTAVSDKYILGNHLKYKCELHEKKSRISECAKSTLCAINGRNSVNSGRVDINFSRWVTVASKRALYSCVVSGGKSAGCTATSTSCTGNCTAGKKPLLSHPLLYRRMNGEYDCF